MPAYLRSRVEMSSLCQTAIMYDRETIIMSMSGVHVHEAEIVGGCHSSKEWYHT